LKLRTFHRCGDVFQDEFINIKRFLSFRLGYRTVLAFAYLPGALGVSSSDSVSLWMHEPVELEAHSNPTDVDSKVLLADSQGPSPKP